MEEVAPFAPTIPPRTHRKSSHRPSSSSAKSAIQSSPSAKTARPHSSSPEVISSLISSLAAISTDAEQHFDQLPRIGSNRNSGASLNSRPRRSSVPNSLRQGSDVPELAPESPPLPEGFGVDYGAYKQPRVGDEQSYLLENTAFPPVVRMSKPRVASSNSLSRTPTLKGSQQSLNARDEPASIGRLSTEPGLQPPSPGLPSPRSSTFNRIMGRRMSKESLSNGQGERPRSSDPNNHTLGHLSVNLKHSCSRGSLKEDVIDETTAGWQPTSASPLTPRHSRHSSNAPVPASNSPRPDRLGGMGNARVIPSRQSSLNHAGVRSPGKRSSKHSRHSREKKDLNSGRDVADEENATLRRIRELQKQKQKREKEQRKEERKREMKKPQAPVPRPRSLRRTASGQSSGHSKSEPPSQTPNEPSPTNNADAHKPVILKTSGLAEFPSTASFPSRPDADSTKPESGHLAEGGGPTSGLDQRIPADAQISPSRGSFGADRPQSANSIHDAVDAYLASPSLTQRLRHPVSGRMIAFSEVGDPRGFPVICCVGMGMTRYIMAFYDELAITLRLRLITIDRPGVGESEPCSDGTGTPLNWPDDISIVCKALSISKFSLVAHSAGAVYALATALRLPQQVRGRLHLMAAWIPPSQLSSNATQNDSVLSNSVPYTQKLLRVLPESLLKAANSSLMSSTTSSISQKATRRARQKSPFSSNRVIESPRTSSSGFRGDRNSIQTNTSTAKNFSTDISGPSSHPLVKDARDTAPSHVTAALGDDDLSRARQYAYDSHLTQLIWNLAQRHANPAVDLLVCIERRQTIGFRYVDITRPCVFHHGSRDSRVPVENVKWLAKKMRRTEVRVLDGEGHSLMASAKIMGGVLTEVAREWEDWARVTRDGRGRRIVSDHFND